MMYGLVSTLKSKKYDLISLALLCFAFYCGFKHLRFTGFAMLTAAVFGTTYFSRSVVLVRRRFAARALLVERAGALVGAVALLIMVVQITAAALKRDTWTLNTNAYPLAAIEWLRRSGETGRLLVDFNNGSFALFWSLSMDGMRRCIKTRHFMMSLERYLPKQSREKRHSKRSIQPTFYGLLQRSRRKEHLVYLRSGKRYIEMSGTFSLV
jgi:hypothetical protein